MGKQNHSSLLNKLDDFIRKYYKNRILRGVIYSVGIILAFYLAITLLEAVGKFGSSTRTVLFWAFALTSISVFAWYIIVPTLKLFRLGKTLSYKEASLIVGNHFPEVKDKLLNTLQLQESHGVINSDSLLAASIEQRTSELSPVPFTSAIDLGENTKYLKYALPPLAVILILLFAAPSLLKDSTDRLIRFNEEIVPVAPFSLMLSNNALEVPEREDFELLVAAEGEEIPDKVYIELNGNRFKMTNEGKTSFNYLFRNVDANQEFRLYANGFYFGPYSLEMLAKPVLVNFEVALNYPSYTGLKDETLRNAGDFTVPAGTEVSWNFNTKNAEALRLRLGDSVLTLVPSGANRFSSSTRALRGTSYSLMPMNDRVSSSDSMNYRLNVTPDRYPSIQIEEQKDSVLSKNVFFTGEVQDDYGFKRLSFNYTFTKSENTARQLNEKQTINLPVPNATADRFFYHWALEEIGIQAGEELSYYFEVFDNDGVSGSKSTRTLERIYAAPTLDEVREDRDQENEDIKDKLKESLEDARDLQKELEELRKDLLQKEEVGWQEKQKLEDLLNKQKQLQEQIEEVQQQNEDKNNRQQEFEQQNESIQEKQKELQKLMDEVMNDELKKLYEDIQKLMEEMDKDKLQESVEQMEMSQEDLEKELDRALEQFKQLEFEQKMEETIDDLKKLAEEQEKLAEESKKEDANSEELEKEQEKLNEKFEELQKEMEELEKMNEELEDKQNLPDTQDQEEKIKEEMKDSQESLQKKKSKKASESQQNAADEMEQMAQQMEESMAQNEEESAEEDMEALRALLENIITLSFDQEQLMANFKTIEEDDPKYVAYGQVQHKLKDDAKMVEDSLFALSKRVVQIEAIVNREINLVNEHMSDAIDEIGERKTAEVTRNQQYVMTSFNNLALLLDEALQQMQSQMACKKPGTGNCEKPGGQGAPKPSNKASDLKKMQEALSKQLEEMKDSMGKSGKAGEGEGKNGKQGMSKELAEMAAKQAAIRQMMDKMGQDLNEDGSGAGNGIKQIAKEMEQVEEDIVNKNITQETLKRQEDILIRLLEAEEAERTRGQEEKRKSKSGNQELRGTPANLDEYRKQKEKEIELLRTMPPSLKPYYKDKVNDYFNNLDR